MKRLSIAFSVAALAVPLCAQDKPPANTTTTVLAQPATTQAQDSPLVRAAKATKKTQTKKSIVITNDNLSKSGGHLYVANQSPNPPASAALPKPDTSVAKIQADLRAKAEADAAKAKADADAKANKESAASRDKKAQAAAADYYGESIEERVDDPAQQEHVMNQMTPTQPQTAQPTKPPQE